MNQYLSDKIRVLSLLSIVLVVYIHTYYTEGEAMPTLSWLERLIGGGICRMAVPMFYVISGYLFFLKCDDGVKSTLPKMRKRVRTLLVPYLLANILTFAFYVAVNVVADHVPAIGSVLNFRVLAWLDEGTLTLVKNVFWGPIAFQLWFVRDLMIVVLLSPLVYLWLRMSCKEPAGLALFVVMEVLFYLLWEVNGCFTALFWFSIGGLFAMNPSYSVIDIDSKSGVVAFIVYIVLCVIHAFALLPEWGVTLIAVFGVYGAWCIYDKLLNIKVLPLPPIRILPICRYTFFIYLVHEPLLNIFKKLPLLVSRSELTITICYLVIPPIFCAFAIVLGRVLEKLLPRAYKVYTGGR